MSSSIPPKGRPSQAASGGAAVGGAADARSAGGISSDELLPPIEPPSAKFILQLFVVPAVIVAAVVLFWFVIESLARSGVEDPEQIVQGLRSSNQARFQKANDLANMLRMPQRYPQLKTNHELAQKLAALLDEQMTAADDSEAAVRMRLFLCSALGEFHVDDGLPVLLKAARSDPERDIRRRAINSISVLASEMSKLTPPQPLAGEELVDALVALAEDQDELIRSETAFALGVTASAPDADSRLAEKLAELADDPYTDARFNAAAALARLGDPRAAKGVAEMLDPESIASSLTGEKAMAEDVDQRALASQKAYKRNTIINSALAAIETLIEKKSLPPDGLATIEKSLSSFLAAAPQMTDPAPLPGALVDAAKKTLAKVQAAH